LETFQERKVWGQGSLGVNLPFREFGGVKGKWGIRVIKGLKARIRGTLLLGKKGFLN